MWASDTNLQLLASSAVAALVIAIVIRLWHSLGGPRPRKKIERKRPKDATAAADATSDADRPQCWICLEEGPDEAGRPPVRDCSCRGSAGFAHLSCIVEYARSKERDQSGRGGNLDHRLIHILKMLTEDGENPWETCPNCHQPYQNMLAVDLATEHISFLGKNHPNDKFAYLKAHSTKMKKYEDMGLHRLDSNEREQAKQLANKTLSLIEKMRHTRMESVQTQTVEELAYGFLGRIALNEGTKESAKMAVKYFEKHLHLMKASGPTGNEDRDVFRNKLIRDAEAYLARAKAMQMQEGGGNGPKKTTTGPDLKVCRSLYEYHVKEKGDESLHAIMSGIALATSLYAEHHYIKAERLLTKLIAKSQRVHGKDHHVTKRAERDLQACKVRPVLVRTNDGWKFFKALRSEGGEERYVVQGPMADDGHPPSGEEEKISTVDGKGLIPTPGSIVVCRGLRNAMHLNGKLGDVRAVDTAILRCQVHFEDSTLKPCLVKPENLRVLIDLPPA